MPDAGESGKRCFEFAHLGTLDELTMRQDASHRVIDRAAETAALGHDIDKGDRLLFHADMLIHDRCWLLFAAIPAGTIVTS